MSVWQVLKTAVFGLSSNLLRALLTTLGIVIGVASVISMLALGNGARAAVEANFRHLGSDVVQITVKEKIDDGDFIPVGEVLSFRDGLAMKREIGLVERVLMSVGGQGKVRYGRHVLDMPIAGATADALLDIALQNETQPIGWPTDQRLTPEAFIAEGRFFTPTEVFSTADVCVLGHKTALDLFGGSSPLDEVVWVNRQRCVVIGVMAELEVTNPALRNRARPNEAFYLPLSTAINNLFEREPSVVITAKIGDESRMVEARQDIINFLRRQHAVEQDEDGEYEDDFELVTRQDILGAQQEAARTFSFLLAAMAAVSLLVGGIGIMNVMLVSVTERTREIGVRMAVGAKPADIVAQFLVEAVLISGGGGILGICIGVLTIPAVAGLNNGVALLDPQSIPLAFGVALLTGVLFGLYPAVRAAQLDPIEALRYE